MSFEDLRVYQAAELIDEEVTRLVKLFPPRYAKLIDQLRRAASAIPFNIAESFGSLEKGKKLTHLGVSRGSADEVRSELRKAVRDGLIIQKEADRAMNLCRTVAKMLTAMIEGMS